MLLSRRDLWKCALAGAARCRTEHPPRDRASRRGPTRCATCRSPPRQRNIRRWPRRRGIGVDDRNGRIAGVGDAGSGLCARTINLGGRTVVPGLFDAHVHYPEPASIPATRGIERAFSIAELQDAIATRSASVRRAPSSCIGGWNHTQLAENRRPTKSDLDAAAPKHGVYISGTGGGTGAITNSVGRVLRRERVMVDDTGAVVASATCPPRSRPSRRRQTGCVVRPI